MLLILLFVIIIECLIIKIIIISVTIILFIYFNISTIISGSSNC